MIRDKKIIMVGVSDEDSAQLRLLLRKVKPQLQHRWGWGTETNADLVIVDQANFSGQMGWTRAQGSGRRCALLTDDEQTPDADLLLVKPLKLGNLLDVLRRIETESTTDTWIIHQKDDFYNPADPSLEMVDDIEDGSLRLPAVDPLPEQPGLDQFLAAQTPQLIPPPPVPTESKKSAASNQWTVALTPKVAASTFTALDISSAPIAKESAELNMNPVVNTPQYRVHGMGGPETHSLVDYLNDNLLGAPARIMLEGAPTLVLDPKVRVYHADNGSLLALQSYCTTSLQRDNWHPLTNTELTQVRTDSPPQSYQRLIWLNALTHSGGRLAGHLDPGGKYSLLEVQLIEAEEEFPHHSQIAKAMQQPAKLNEIAAASGRPMEEVIDFINAHDAIGNIQVERRASRYAEPNPGLFGRLRKSLGIS